MLFQIVAVILLLIFYGIYFGKNLKQRKQGIQTNLLGKGKTGFVLFIELSLKAMSITILFVEVFSIFLLESSSPFFVRILGIVFGIVGDVFFGLAVYTMKDSWRAGVPENEKTKFISNGIFQYSRNPAFFGFDCVYIGILLMFFNVYLLIVTVITILIFHLQIVNVEEDYLLTTFGDSYTAYKNQVNRYLGRKK